MTAGSEVKVIEGEVKAAAEKVVAEVEKVVDAVKVDISTEEKLLVRSLENDYLKAQLEMQRLSLTVKSTTEQYTKTIEGFVKKYALDTKYAFDSVELAFRKK